MPIYLPKELETEVYGTGEGFICISQKDMMVKKQLLHCLCINLKPFGTTKKHLLKRP